MSDDERENWEGASDEELQAGIEEGEPDAIAEYASRLHGEGEQAKALLRRWYRHARKADVFHSLQYETLGLLDETKPPELIQRLRAPARAPGTGPVEPPAATPGPLPVARLDQVRLRDNQDVRWLVHAWYDNGGTAGGLDKLLDAIEAHLAGQAVPVEVDPVTRTTKEPHHAK